MVNRIVRATGEFVDVVRDLDCKTVMQVAGQHEDRLVQAVPKFNQFLPFLEEDSPGIVLLDRRLLVIPSPASNVRNHEVDGRNHEYEVRLALADSFLEPIQLTLPDHSGLRVVRVVHVMKASV